MHAHPGRSVSGLTISFAVSKLHTFVIRNQQRVWGFVGVETEHVHFQHVVFFLEKVPPLEGRRRASYKPHWSFTLQAFEQDLASSIPSLSCKGATLITSQCLGIF